MASQSGSGSGPFRESNCWPGLSSLKTHGESTSKLTHVAVGRRLRFLAMWASARICSRPDFPKTKSSERDRVYEREVIT